MKHHWRISPTVEVDPLLFGCEYMTQGKGTLTPDCTSVPDSPFHHLECSSRPTSHPRNSRFVIELKPLSGKLGPTQVIDLS